MRTRLTIQDIVKWAHAAQVWAAQPPQDPGGLQDADPDYIATIPDEIVFEGKVWPVDWNRTTNVITTHIDS